MRYALPQYKYINLKDHDMKKTMLLLPISLLISHKIHSMELPPTFMPAGKQEGKPSLYLDEKANDEFASRIHKIIADTLNISPNALHDELTKYAHNHTVDAETYWHLKKEIIIGVAKGERDIARAYASCNRCLENRKYVKNANINLGCLKSFKVMIAREKQLQALQKKN